MTIKVHITPQAAEAILRVVVDSLPGAIDGLLGRGEIRDGVMDTLCEELSDTIQEYAEMVVEP